MSVRLRSAEIFLRQLPNCPEAPNTTIFIEYFYNAWVTKLNNASGKEVLFGDYYFAECGLTYFGANIGGIPIGGPKRLGM
ncbi:hypothetical protein GCM10007423_64310 [Dyadobacter endophyticus]|uniref:Uncharacterized protein n=1 Tax=Dyadobacter endophyticus TaxID=1749036 RepID=A0ABQ1ZBH7_9BACT|nr:hypothetical protein GCM10007423_64310 [Dyadobacter endophyticus]